jgi:hypothetical protein
MVLAARSRGVKLISTRMRWGWLRPAITALILLGTFETLPFMVPILAREKFLSYQSGLLFQAKSRPDEKSILEERMPHLYAFPFGWEDVVQGSERFIAACPPKNARTPLFCERFCLRWCDRHHRSQVRPSKVNRRASELLVMGPAQRYRPDHDSCRDHS